MRHQLSDKTRKSVTANEALKMILSYFLLAEVFEVVKRLYQLRGETG